MVQKPADAPSERSRDPTITTTKAPRASNATELDWIRMFARFPCVKKKGLRNANIPQMSNRTISGPVWIVRKARANPSPRVGATASTAPLWWLAPLAVPTIWLIVWSEVRAAMTPVVALDCNSNNDVPPKGDRVTQASCILLPATSAPRRRCRRASQMKRFGRTAERRHRFDLTHAAGFGYSELWKRAFGFGEACEALLVPSLRLTSGGDDDCPFRRSLHPATCPALLSSLRLLKQSVGLIGWSRISGC
jgi:hypothetical protein